MTTPAPVMPVSLEPVPLSMTDHAPAGAWMSLRFGEAERGAEIRINGAVEEADLLVGVKRGEEIQAMPFVGETEGFVNWRFAAGEKMRRTLSPCVDEFSLAEAGLTLRVLTPQPALPNPKRSGNLQYASAPGMLIELVVDNSGSDVEALAGVGLRAGGALRPLDWSSKTLCGVGGGRWVLAAVPVKDEVATLQGALHEGSLGVIDPSTECGGVVMRVAPRSTKTLTLVLVAYVQGLVTQGLDGRYFYTQYFPRVEAAANFLLHNQQRVRESCTGFDSRATGVLGDSQKVAAFGRGVREFNRGTQVMDVFQEGMNAAHFAMMDARGRRCALDGIGEQLPWMLYRNPWVIRNLFDLATTTYAYQDRLRFAGDGEVRDGGMTFARDFGFGSAYAPGAISAGSGAGRVTAFDGAGSTPGWSGGAYATEVLLNAIYMLTSYALLADDTPWARTRLPFARELMTGLENRDHWDPEQRTGILKGDSVNAGEAGERTAFAIDAEDVPAELAQARGSLYVAVKTFCANLLLTTYYQNNNDLHSADYSYAFAQKTAAAIVGAFDAERQCLKANVLEGGADVRLIAALEPLAVPTYLGLTSTLAEYFPELFNVLKSQVTTCLKAAPEGCVEGGVLRLSSGSGFTQPGKVISILYVAERLFGVDVEGVLPRIWKRLAGDGDAAGLISAALYLKPVQ